MTIGQELFLGATFSIQPVLWNIHPQGTLQGGRLRVAILGSVLMATIMIGAEKICLSLGRANQPNYPAFVGA